MKENEKKINRTEEKILKPNNVKDLATGMLYYNSASILGPLILFVGIGILLDNYFNTKPYLIVTGLIIAFITSNALIFRKIKKLTSESKNISKEENNRKINN